MSGGGIVLFSVKCYFQINCQPRVVNIFDEIKLPVCNQNMSKKVLDTMFGKPKGQGCDHCLMPCNRILYNFKVSLVDLTMQ